MNHGNVENEVDNDVSEIMNIIQTRISKLDKKQLPYYLLNIFPNIVWNSLGCSVKANDLEKFLGMVFDTILVEKDNFIQFFSSVQLEADMQGLNNKPSTYSLDIGLGHRHA